MIQNRKSASLIGRATKPVIEFLEQRQLLSATLSVSSSLMVFNAVENSSASQVETLTLTDSGDADLTLGAGSATVGTARFTVTNESSIPATLAPGQSFGLQLQYNAVAVTTDDDTLSIASDASNPVVSVTLHGIGTKGLGGSNQPSLATILQAYDIPTFVGDGPDDADALQDNTYPYPPDATSQEVDLQRMVKAGAGPVTIDVLASFTASGTHPLTIGTYTPGDPSQLSQLFTTPSSEAQSVYVQPVGATSFDPGSSPFGFYFVSNVQVTGRVGYTEDALNTWDSTTGRHFRFFPMEEPDGTIVPNEFIMTSTEWNAPVGYDFTNVVAIVSNIEAAPDAPNGPSISLVNPDAVPGSTTMVFSRIESPNTVYPNTVHDTNVLEITNTANSSGGALIISSYTLTTGYVLVNPPTFPLSIAPGATQDLTIKFTVSSEPSVPYNETNSPMYGSGGGVFDGTLTLTTNDIDNPTASQKLAGWYQYHSENSNEPSLQSIVNLLFGYSTEINPTPTPTLTESSSTSGSSPTYYGQEVVSDFWQQADTGSSESVSVEQIAGFHTEGNIATTYWYPKGTSTYNKLFVTDPDSGQTLFPLLNGSSTALAMANFSTTGTFGFRVDNEYSNDAQNTALMTGGGHHFRFYPIITASGQVIPNDYIMTMDYSNTPQNFDFQDNVWIVTNIKPSTVASNISSPQTTGGGPATPLDFYATNTTGGNLLQWGEVTSSGVGGFDVYSATSSAGPYTLLTPSPISALTYTDTAAPSTGTSYYKVIAIGASTSDPSIAATASVPNANSNGGGGSMTGTPVTTAISANTSAGVAVTVNELVTATDATGTLLPATVIVTTQPADGTTSVNASNGAITYTPNPGFTGTDTFQYTVTDNTGSTSAPSTVTIDVIAVPVGDPVAANLSEDTAFNTALNIDVLASAAEGTSSATLEPSTVAIVQAPADGTAVVDPTTGDILYTPTTGFSGSDTFSYSIGDSLMAVSPTATITITVEPAGVVPPPINPVSPVNPTGPTPVAASITAPPLAGTGTSTINVISAATDPDGTINPASLAIIANPTNGTATLNAATGTISYTPNAGFIGVDTLKYSLADVDGNVSSAATLSFSVGVTINNTTAKMLSFTDANGSKVRVTLTGGGTGLVFFNGSGTATTVKGPHGTGTVTVAGNGLSISGMQITGSTIAGALTVTRVGTAAVSLANIAVTGELDRLIATTSALTGTLSVTGAMTTIEIGSANAATITIGSTGATRAGLTFIAGSVTNTSLTSGTSIRTLQATSWTESGATDAVSAPSITTLVTKGNFEAGLTVTGGSPYSLQTVHVGGQISADPWSVTGNTANILVGSVAPGWSGGFTGSLNTFTVRAGGFAGTLTGGNINSVSITGNDTGGINAASLRSARIVGQLSSGYVITTNGVAPRTNSLGRLTITGETTDSQIISAGNIGTITSGGLSGSSIDAGINNGVDLPTSASDFAAAASIASFAITGRAATFSDSDIAAMAIGTLSLGEIITASSESKFGIAAGTIRSATFSLDSTIGAQRLNSLVLASTDSIAAYVASKKLTLNSFEILPGL